MEEPIRVGSLNNFMVQSFLPPNPTLAIGLLCKPERKFHCVKTVRLFGVFVEAVSRLS